MMDSSGKQPTQEGSAKTNPSVLPHCLKKYFVDFSTTGHGETLAAGDIIDNTVLFFNAVTFKARRRQDGSGVAYDKGMIFDTFHSPHAQVHGNLHFKEQGNFLVISEIGDSYQPVANKHGGDIVANFVHPATVLSLRVLSVEASKQNYVEFYDWRSNLVKIIPIGHLKKGEAHQLFPMIDNVTSFTVKLDKVGALDNVEFTNGCGTWGRTPRGGSKEKDKSATAPQEYQKGGTDFRTVRSPTTTPSTFVSQALSGHTPSPTSPVPSIPNLTTTTTVRVTMFGLPVVATRAILIALLVVVSCCWIIQCKVWCSIRNNARGAASRSRSSQRDPLNRRSTNENPEDWGGSTLSTADTGFSTIFS